MKLNDQQQRQKEWIDTSTYTQLLHKWRFAPVGDPMFSADNDPIPEYYSMVMGEKKAATGDNGVSASKRVGW